MTQNDPAVLRQVALGLWDRRARGELLEPEIFGALVEATFRLAVHPQTAPEDTLVLLRRARRLDPADPRHVYHLGLFWLRHGRLDEAAKELREAGRLAPTSHRIWAHQAILQRRLDEQRVGAAGYAGELRRRADEINAAIRAGTDNPDPGPGGPEPSPHLGVTAVRLGRAGECRWTGVRDLDVEDRLLGTPSERSRDWLLTELTELARLAAGRRGGAAAFAILGVQWLLRGYPKATLRALAAPLDTSGPAGRLLADVLALYDRPATEVPDALARHLRDGTLPEFLVLQLCRALLLTRPLDFPDLDAYRAAKELVNQPGEPDPGETGRCVSALMSAVRRLEPAPVERVADAVPAPAETGDADSLLVRLEAGATRFKQQDTTALDLAKSLRTAAAAGTPVAGDLPVLEEAAEALKSAAATLLADWDAVGKAERGTLPPDDFQHRYQTIKRDLQNTNHGRTKQQLKLAKKALAKMPGGGPSEVSAPVKALRDALRTPDDTTPAARPEPPRPRPEPTGTGRDLVASALSIADATMGEAFAQAHTAVGALPAGETRRLLVREVSGREAEAAYRLGYTVHARQVWSRMLIADPYDCAVLHNLAMAHTAAGDLAAAAEGWQAYLSALYALDVATGDPRGHAAERAGLHRALAGAFGNSVLTTMDGQDGPEPREVTAALAGAARMAAYERHLRLETLNRRLTGHGTRLRLGVSPDAAEDVLAAARDRAVADARTACAHLPRRIAEPFAALCEETLSAPEPPRRSPDTAEDDDHAALVDRLLRQRLRLREMLFKDRTWCLSPYSGDVIAGIGRIDGLLLDAADDVTTAAVQQLKSGTDPAAFIAELSGLADLACQVALDRVFTEAEGDDPLFPGRYRATGESWVRTSVPDKYLRILDGPSLAHPPVVQRAMTLAQRPDAELDEDARAVLAEAIGTLATWTERLHGASGPPAHRAELLSTLGRHDEAYRVLDDAAKVAFAPGDRIERARISVDYATKNFASAVRRVRGLLAAGETEALKRLLADAYRGWISVAPPAPERTEIERDFESWTDPRSVRDRRFLVVRATMAGLTNASGAAIEAAMRRLVADDPGNRDASFHLIRDGIVRELEELRLRERNNQGPARRRVFEERRKLVDLCRKCCELYLAEPDDKDDPLAEDRRDVLKDLLRQLGGG